MHRNVNTKLAGCPSFLKIRHTDVWWMLLKLKKERDKIPEKSLHNKDYLPLSFFIFLRSSIEASG